MMILDTHAWIWWATDSAKLSKAARRAIGDTETVGICAISGWELAMLVSRDRIQLDRSPLDWIRHSLESPRVAWLELTPEIAATAGGLGRPFHGDPADRLVVASAIEYRVTLVTKDERIRQFAPVTTLW